MIKNVKILSNFVIWFVPVNGLATLGALAGARASVCTVMTNVRFMYIGLKVNIVMLYMNLKSQSIKPVNFVAFTSEQF